MKKRSSNRLPIGLASVLIATVFAPLGAKCQQAAASGSPAASQAPAGGSELQKITVTGYIIPRVGDGPQPVITIDRNYIQQLGAQTVSDVLQRLPHVPAMLAAGFRMLDTCFVRSG